LVLAQTKVKGETETMNWTSVILGVVILAICIAIAIFTEGIALPIVLPLAIWGLQKMGVKT
jgi:hypothetical protein